MNMKLTGKLSQRLILSSFLPTYPFEAGVINWVWIMSTPRCSCLSVNFLVFYLRITLLFYTIFLWSSWIASHIWHQLGYWDAWSKCKMFIHVPLNVKQMWGMEVQWSLLNSAVFAGNVWSRVQRYNNAKCHCGACVLGRLPREQYGIIIKRQFNESGHKLTGTQSHDVTGQ
jgi:hypothetical protein